MTQQRGRSPRWGPGRLRAQTLFRFAAHIESYKLKPWVDGLLVLRMELYHDEFGDLTEGSEGYQKALEKEHSNEPRLLECDAP